jgi:CheY-like chemotaxis protein
MSMQRVLIVDDEPLLRSLMAEILSRNDFQTVIAEDGQEALNILQDDVEFSLIISDIHMPRMDGITLCKVLKENYPKIPVLITSVHWRNDRLNSLLQDESALYLSRPFTARQFLEKVKATISKFS